jgi:5-methylcytosine-specific restriction endonuclease McrA
MSESQKGKRLGKKASQETREKLSLSHRGLKYPTICQEKHWNWRGGITSKNDTARKSSIYKNWRKTVFERDTYTCLICGNRGGMLHADHIIPFCRDKGKRFDLSNGRTLCATCHKKTDTYGGKMLRQLEQSHGEN